MERPTRRARRSKRKKIQASGDAADHLGGTASFHLLPICGASENEKEAWQPEGEALNVALVPLS